MKNGVKATYVPLFATKRGSYNTGAAASPTVLAAFSTSNTSKTLSTTSELVRSSRYCYLWHIAEADVRIHDTWDHYHRRRTLSSFGKADAVGKLILCVSRSLLV